MKMTRKASVEYVKNDANWHELSGNYYVQCSTMEYGGRKYIRIEELHCVNQLQAVYMHTEKPKLGWSYSGYRYIDEKTGGLVATSETTIADEIYTASKGDKNVT